MTNHANITSPQLIARVAGFLHLLLVPLAIFGTLYVSSKLIVPGDAERTAANILASESLFRFGIATSLLGQVIMMSVALLLYQLLSPVNKNMASLMVIFLLVAVPIATLNKLNQFAALQLISGAGFLKEFSTAQLQSLGYLFLRLHTIGLNIAGIFWGLWLFPMGYLVFKSGFLPKILGVLLIITCLGYLTDSFAFFLGYNVNMVTYTGWGEVLFPLWLLIKGVNIEKWEKMALVFSHGKS